MFELYTFGILLIVVGGTIWGIVRANDTLHPLVYLMPMAGFFYVYMPAELYATGELLTYFSLSEVTYVQGFNLACITALAAGGYLGSRRLQRDASKVDVFSYRFPVSEQKSLFGIGLTLGLIGVTGYLYQIANVGGFYEAYDSAKGGGWATSGYIRDLNFLILPSIVLIYLSRGDKKLRFRHWLLIGGLSVPQLVHGLLSARRGPTFLALATLIGGWYLVRRRRPSIPQLAVGGTAVGLLLLALVTFRGQIYLGSSYLSGNAPAPAEIVEKSLEWSTQSTFGNEYMYSTYVVLNARDQGEHYWGKRYLTQVFIRPIPSALWPTKYEDVGMESFTVNKGQLLTENLNEHPQIPQGSAPGFAGSTYVEWAWGAPIFLLLVGYLYGFVWRRNLVMGGFWTVLYVVLLACSVFFIAQSFLPLLYRTLFMAVPAGVLWYGWVGRRHSFTGALPSEKRRSALQGGKPV